MADKRILIVDDDPDLSLSLQLFLESKQFIVDLASDKEEALGKIMTTHPSLVFLDIEMTGENDGFEICKEIALSHFDHELKVVMVTGKILTILNEDNVAETESSIFGNDKTSPVLVQKDNKTWFTYLTGDCTRKWFPLSAFFSKPVEPSVLLEKAVELMAGE